jgi:glycosyltransferase involved in cell wall biosynthesis
MRLQGSRNIYCVHDLVPLLHPGLTAIDQGRMGRLLGRLRHEASHIVTVSEQSRQDILATLGWPADRVTNTYQAVFLPKVPEAQVAERFGLVRDGYFMHVGTIEPRKNIARLIEAYRASGLSVPLVLAGPDGWGAPGELAAARDMLVERPRASGLPCVVRIPWINRDVLVGLMREARAVVAVSLAEGFGLPIAEAMEIGVPVLTTESGACAEVAGGAALMVDPYDPRAIAAALRALDHDAVLRDQLRAKGHVRASLFTPAAYAGRLKRLYSTVLRQTSEVA